jgi:26S proteasome regulatory subunit N2
MDKLDAAVRLSGDSSNLLAYTFKAVMDYGSIDFRQTVLRSLVQLYKQLNVPDYINVSRCLVFLDDAKSLADILDTLVRAHKSEDETLLAFQIAFELCDNASQQFLANVRKLLPQAAETTAAAPVSASTAAPKEGEKAPLLEADKDAMEVDTSAAPSSNDTPYDRNLRALHKILTGEPTINLHLEFLYRNNHTDLGVLKAIKSAFEPRNSILHTATICSNALMHAGTTRDTFLRENLEWLSRAINWSKFSTTAGLGVIHKGHLKEARKVLEPYLPQPGSNASAFSEGGSLYALGLIHANHGFSGSGESTTQYLLQQIRNNQANETVLHGACLGLGVAAMASGNAEVFDELLNLVYSQDNAIAGEAAGYAMGLVMLGSASARTVEVLNFCHDTQHEKIIRGCAVGLAFIFYGREEEAEAMIEQLTLDKDPILRYGAMFMIGLAYAGTNNNNAIRRLLHVAVSDVNDDVRRAAVMNIGFVLFRQPEQVPKLVALLAESYNPMVRYGACLAIGIACAGTGLKEAFDMLLPMARTDPVDTVRQGALIALGMVFIQVNNQHAQDIRKLLRERVEDKHEFVMAKLGAIMATGIIDAGGRNVTLALKSRAGHRNMQAVVGLAMFLQYWYWYPLTHFISLAFTPTAIIGLNKDLKMPKFSFKSNAPPSQFGYPAEVKAPEAEKKKAVEKVELSATRRAARGRAGAKKDDKMDVDDKKDDKMDVDEEKKEEEKPVVPEAAFEVLANPARVTGAQVKFISFDADERYQPVTDGVMGIILLKDNKPGEPEDIITGSVPSVGGGAADDSEPEPSPPEPFQYFG